MLLFPTCNSASDASNDSASPPSLLSVAFHPHDLASFQKNCTVFDHLLLYYFYASYALRLSMCHPFVPLRFPLIIQCLAQSIRIYHDSARILTSSSHGWSAINPAYSIPTRSFESLVYMLIFLNIKNSFFICLLTSCATRLHKLAPVFIELTLTLVSTMCSSMKSTLSSPLYFTCRELITYGMYLCSHRTHSPLLPHPFASVLSLHNSLTVFLAIHHLKFLTLPYTFHASHSDRSRPSYEPRIVHSLLVKLLMLAFIGTSYLSYPCITLVRPLVFLLLPSHNQPLPSLYSFSTPLSPSFFLPFLGLP